MTDELPTGEPAADESRPVENPTPADEPQPAEVPVPAAEDSTPDVPEPDATVEHAPPEEAAEDEAGPEEGQTFRAGMTVPQPADEEAEAAVAEAEAPSGDGEPAAPEPSNKHWYVVKVQSGREESIKEAIERRVKIEGLEDHYGQIIIPVERVTEMRKGKRVTRERKLYPGYLMVEVEYNDRILYLFRETSGVGDFVGGGVNHPPPPMSDHEVARMIGRQGIEQPGVIPPKPQFDRGDRVKVKDGTFAGMEGEVKDILEAKGLVRVELTIFGRPVPVELEYWQVEHS